MVVVGLGPAGTSLVPDDTRAVLGGDYPRFLRTSRHPAAAEFDIPSFDRLYQELPSFEAVYQAIAAEMVVAAEQAGQAVLAVPGSPLVGEAVVGLLASRSEIDLEVRPALSFLDLAWLRLGVDPVKASVRLIDAQDFARQGAGQIGPFLVAQCWSTEVLSEVKLAFEDPPESEVVLLHHLGLDDEVIAEVAWEDMDRSIRADHLTCMWVPQLASPVASELVGLVDLARVLRQRCPWDIDQTHQSLARHMREEAYELIDAISGLGPDGEGDEELEEELGDVLYQVLAHSQIATEEGRFGLADVARTVTDKLVGRHPHVFSSTVANDVESVARNWEEIKKKEKNRESVMDGIISDLPALALAKAVQSRAARITPAPVLAPPEGAAEEVGSALWKAVKAATAKGVDAEGALRMLALARLGAYREADLARSAGPGVSTGPVGAGDDTLLS